jgi:hypothetical protein
VKQVLSYIFGAKKDEMSKQFRELHTKKLRDSYRSPSIAREMKSRRLQYDENMAGMEETKNLCRILIGNLLKNDHVGDREGHGRTTLILSCRITFSGWNMDGTG